MHQKLFQIFVSQETGASRKGTSKTTPKIKKISIKYLQRIFALLAIHCKW